jgi:hypothetical protein
MLSFLVPVLFTFYVPNVLKNLKNSGAKRLNGHKSLWYSQETAHSGEARRLERQADRKTLRKVLNSNPYCQVPANKKDTSQQSVNGELWWPSLRYVTLGHRRTAKSGAKTKVPEVNH